MTDVPDGFMTDVPDMLLEEAEEARTLDFNNLNIFEIFLILFLIVLFAFAGIYLFIFSLFAFVNSFNLFTNFLEVVFTSPPYTFLVYFLCDLHFLRVFVSVILS